MYCGRRGAFRGVVQLRQRDRRGQASDHRARNVGREGRDGIDREFRKPEQAADQETVALGRGREPHAVHHEGIAETEGPGKKRREKGDAVFLPGDDVIKRHLRDDLDIEGYEECDMRRDDADREREREQAQGAAQAGRHELRRVSVVSFGDPGRKVIEAADGDDRAEQHENGNMASEIENAGDQGRGDRQQRAHAQAA